jgi:orotidine-5'-phosphate decarboxylase
VQDPRQRLVFALDVDDLSQATELADRMAGILRWTKVGSRLFCSAGPAVVEMLRGRGFEVFLDLKFHDIPDQVRGGCQEAGRLGASMLTVHTSGGAAMMAAAVEGAATGAAAAGEAAPVVLGVTVLTSLDEPVLRSVGVQASPADQVIRLATLAREAGVGGVVCSPREVARIRQLHTRPFILLTPGIRLAGAALDDQARTATPEVAIAEGADYLVVGRPIRTAADPAAAVETILEQMAHGAERT